ncbi:hypothetical protein GALMADRAFT_258794 [Galerina marginata CBS 339.88]|uniref:DUF8205 domain-containing protein n=1 Tax=Galerina marginata (strain CBS 339.88) TaxID=685588 RepID=A0A067S7R4_GALM3|nr:hypothetical protein GALMADRAFT_258794 [Galerina marginata CBS 339.88]
MLGSEKKINAACTYCARVPRLNERFQSCARGAKCCRIALGSARRRKDWPEHKLYCDDRDMHCKYMMKYLKHVNEEIATLPPLRLALVAAFYHELMTSNPDPRKMWVVTAVAAILPLDTNHFKELEDTNIPLNSLSGKPMMGSLRFVDAIDISNTTDYPLDDRSRAIWQAHREHMDKQGRSDVLVVLAKFTYWNQVLLMVPFAVSRKDLAVYGIGGLENPRMLQELNAAIVGEALGGANPKKWTCLLGDNDKKNTRDWAVEGKARQAKHGIKVTSSV